MSKWTLLLILPIVFFVWSCSEDETSILTEEETTTEVEDNSITVEILELVNKHRKEQGLNSLKKNTTADNLAIKHTNYMIAEGEISHDYFDARFQELQQKENARSAGENVASGYQDASSVMNGWLNSPGHKANIEGNFTHLGLAAIKNKQGRFYFTQIFFR